jgi:putative heme-binding domain-containing protein
VGMVQHAIILCFVISSAVGSMPGERNMLTSAEQEAGPPLEVKGKLKDPQFIAEGAKLFANACSNSYCHGAGGGGGVGPRLRGKPLSANYTFDITSKGIPGTSMISFKSELSEEQIWRVVAFVLSDPKTNSAGEPPTADLSSGSSRPREPATDSLVVGSVQAGKDLFFDSAQSKRCAACHSFAGKGTTIGPDLSKSGIKSARELFKSIILPQGAINSRYAKLTITLQNGDKIVGVRKEEDAQSIRIYDTGVLPAVLRTIRRSDIVRIDASTESVMPKDYASFFSIRQLLDLVAFLKSVNSDSPVTLQDVFQ